MITSNHISKLLKMQLESKSQNVHTEGTFSGFISNHAVTTQKSISIGDSHIGKPRICVRLHLVYSNHYSIIVLVLGSSSTYSEHINYSGQDGLNIFFRAPLFRSGLEARSNKNSNTNPVSTKCRLQTADRVQNAD